MEILVSLTISVFSSWLTLISVMDNYPDFLSGKPMRAASSTTELGVGATKRCIEEWQGDPSRIGLLIAATNTPDQMLPCLASEIMGKTHGLLSRRPNRAAFGP